MSAVYKSCDSVVRTLEAHEAENDLHLIRELLSLYDRYRPNSSLRIGNESKNSLIAFEGLDGSGKSTIMKLLDKKIVCTKIMTPPNSMNSAKIYFDKKSPKLKRAFYSFGNYIAAERMKEAMESCTVLVDRFWHSTCAFALAEEAGNVKNLPPPESDVYLWPEDLLKPDAVIFLDVNEIFRAQRLSRRTSITDEESRLLSDDDFRNALLTAYSRMRDPPIIKIPSFKPPKAVADDVLKELVHLGISFQVRK